MVLKLGTLERSEIPFEVLNYGAGEGWRKSAGPTVREMKKYYIESYIRQSKES
jgi:hypothetical protein